RFRERESARDGQPARRLLGRRRTAQPPAARPRSARRDARLLFRQGRRCVEDPVQLIDPQREGWSPHADEGFIEHVGPIWERRDADGTRYGFVAHPKHANLLGVVQGGMLMTFADRALGLRAWEAAE